VIPQGPCPRRRVTAASPVAKAEVELLGLYLHDDVQ
jgi:hypothetical protein